MDWRVITRILLVALMLYVFYSIGVPLPAVIVLGALLIAFILLRGHAYRQVDVFLTKRFPSMAGWAPWQRRALAAIVFVVVLIAVKQGIYEILKLVGMDVQKMVLDGINASMKG